MTRAYQPSPSARSCATHGVTSPTSSMTRMPLTYPTMPMGSSITVEARPAASSRSVSPRPVKMASSCVCIRTTRAAAPGHASNRNSAMGTSVQRSTPADASPKNTASRMATIGVGAYQKCYGTPSSM